MTMFGCTLWPIVLGGFWLADIGQVGVEPVERPRQAAPFDATPSDAATVEVTASKLVVYDKPQQASYLTGSLKQGERVKVRERLAGGWLAIDPPASAICWIDGSALEFTRDADRSGSHFRDPAGSRAAIPTRSWVAASQAVVRSGHPTAQLPGPPCGALSTGTMVHLVDRPPIEVGRGKSATTWYAIVPPAGVVRYVRADGTRPTASLPNRAAERLAAYEPAQDGASTVRKLNRSGAKSDAPGQDSPEVLPPEIAGEIAKVDLMHRSILSDQPIEQWHFETVRARYRAILKRASANRSVEEAIRRRLERLTRHEQAAQAARSIQTILARSHRRDSQVAAAERQRSTPDRERPRAYSAEGLVKPSAQMVDGRRLYSLVGTDGQTVAYLDVPAGLDIEPLVTRRIGVRGVSHYNEDLGARLITVRDVELLETRR